MSDITLPGDADDVPVTLPGAVESEESEDASAQESAAYSVREGGGGGADKGLVIILAPLTVVVGRPW